LFVYQFSENSETSAIAKLKQHYGSAGLYNSTLYNKIKSIVRKYEYFQHLSGRQTEFDRFVAFCREYFPLIATSLSISEPQEGSDEPITSTPQLVPGLGHDFTSQLVPGPSHASTHLKSCFPRRKKRMNRSKKVGLKRVHLNENYLDLPEYADNVRNGHILFVYQFSENSETSAIAKLKQHYGSAGLYNSTLYNKIKSIVRKYEYFQHLSGRQTEFDRFVAFCREYFPLIATSLSISEPQEGSDEPITSTPQPIPGLGHAFTPQLVPGPSHASTIKKIKIEKFDAIPHEDLFLLKQEKKLIQQQ